ncbi:MAG: RNA methyltransferase [Bdellovibrio sp.]
MISDIEVPRMAIGLLHYPIKDTKKQIVATNITNFDIHDIARASTVYGVEKYYLIHPMQEQLMFVDRVLDHWRIGEGSKFNQSRKKALKNVQTATSLEAALADWNTDCLTVGTHAQPVAGTRHFTIPELRDEMRIEKKPIFLLFGTGSGMTDEFMQGLDAIVESIRGAPPQDFRHLSVRSAVSIYLDRLMGPW